MSLFSGLKNSSEIVAAVGLTGAFKFLYDDFVLSIRLYGGYGMVKR